MTTPHPESPGAGPTAEETSGRGESVFFAPYSEFAKTLRTWFVAYGVGAPVLIVSQARIADRLSNSDAQTIALSFLLGAVVQVIQAIVFKVAMWHLYMAELKPDEPPPRWSANISEALWLELFFDFLTLALFAFATGKLIVALTGNAVGAPPPMP